MNNVGQNATWIIIVNPNAGSRKAYKDWPKIAELLYNKGITHQHVFTTHRLHAFDLCMGFLKDGYRKFIVVGGDGTLNEIVNAIFNTDACQPEDCLIALIPVGTGNDWGRMFSIPQNYEKALDLIVAGKTFVQDVGKAEFHHHNHKETRYFANIAGIGYDALVAKRTNILKDKKWFGGKLLYLYSLAISLLTYQTHKAKIFCNDQFFETDIFSLSAGIGKFNGGGIKQLPDAIADDGLFDITIITKIGKFEVIKQMKNLYDGSFTRHHSVKTLKTQKIRIEAGLNFYLEVDGESLGHTPFTFEIIPKSLRAIVG